jgi:hypothetical protein
MLEPKKTNLDYHTLLNKSSRCILVRAFCWSFVCCVFYFFVFAFKEQAKQGWWMMRPYRLELVQP